MEMVLTRRRSLSTCPGIYYVHCRLVYRPEILLERDPRQPRHSLEAQECYVDDWDGADGLDSGHWGVDVLQVKHLQCLVIDQ
jgi:hypothetical protein